MADEIKTTAAEAPESRNFIHTFIEEDIAQGGQFEGMTVHTRFPPEPNGYLHIGHCKALTIDFGTAEKFGGLCNLRMDDTNPTKEDEEFVEAIKEDIHWLGFDWGDRFFYGSDYFEEDYRQAVGLIKKGLAYVCELSPEEFRAHRGDIGFGRAAGGAYRQSAPAPCLESGGGGHVPLRRPDAGTDVGAANGPSTPLGGRRDIGGRRKSGGSGLSAGQPSL